MKSSSAQYLKKQSGENNLAPRSFKGKSTAKKREREDADSKDEGLVSEIGEDSQKQHLPEISKNSAKISVKQHLKLKVDQLLCKHDNRPLKALWEALNDKATPGIELPMAIVMDPRCGIERRAEKGDGIVDIDGMSLVYYTPLMLAVRLIWLHRNDVIEALLAAGADPSARDIYGRTACLRAATYCNVTAMDLLVRYGADPFAVDAYGSSALHVAALLGKAHVIQWLVDLGASTEAVNDIGQTPLHKAFSDFPSIVALLDNGANLEAVDRFGCTPLHCVSACGHTGAIETLVWEGASITAKDRWGRSPLEIMTDSRFSDAEKAWVKALLTPPLLH